jgi:hypothetical protein
MLVYALYTAGRDDVVEFLLSVGASIEVIVYYTGTSACARESCIIYMCIYRVRMKLVGIGSVCI